jgi:hypothetical protein
MISLRQLTGFSLGLAAAFSVSTTAHAFEVVANVGGSPIGVNRLNFDDLTVGTSGLFSSLGPNGDVSLHILPGAQVAQGSAGGVYAAPYLSSENGDGFGAGGSDQANGIDVTPYLSTGRTEGTTRGIITLSFASAQKYLGLLWGSVDTYNHISFYMDAEEVGVVSGNDPAFAGGNGGDQGMNGTRYVNINSDLPFNTVIFTSDSYAFEFDNVAYSRANVGVPDAGSTTAMLVVAVVGLGVWARRRTPVKPVTTAKVA